MWSKQLCESECILSLISQWCFMHKPAVLPPTDPLQTEQLIISAPSTSLCFFFSFSVPFVFLYLESLNIKTAVYTINFSNIFTEWSIFSAFSNVIIEPQKIETRGVFCLRKKQTKIKQIKTKTGRAFRGNIHFPLLRYFLKFNFLMPHGEGDSFHYKDFMNNVIPVLYWWGVWVKPFLCNAFSSSDTHYSK